MLQTIYFFNLFSMRYSRL